MAPEQEQKRDVACGFPVVFALGRGQAIVIALGHRDRCEA